MTENETAFRDTPKSMEVFFIDNQGIYPEETCKVGDLIVWPDDGAYPTYQPIAMAVHPNFDGSTVVLAGNRGLVVAFVPQARTQDDIRKSLSGKGPKPIQFRIAVDALIHRIVLWKMEDKDFKDDCHPFALLAWLMKSQPAYGAVLIAGLKLLLKSPDAIVEVNKELAEGAGMRTYEGFLLAESMLDSMTMAQGISSPTDLSHLRRKK